jgi:hypothetical protein
MVDQDRGHVAHVGVHGVAERQQLDDGRREDDAFGLGVPEQLP